ncbi:MAG TPA: hypothetical protein VMR81_08395 [Patescibacteria group bacterium]|nr:hypothetical protein [Patescibacteria group bacterium]
MQEFLGWLSERIGTFGAPRKERYVPPTPEQLKASLIATQEILHSPIGRLTDDEKQVRVTLFTRQISGNTTVEEKVELTCALYEVASGRKDANLRKEAPYIIEAIQYEYRPPEPGILEIRPSQSHVEFIGGLFDKEIEIISQQEQGFANGG